MTRDIVPYLENMATGRAGLSATERSELLTAADLIRRSRVVLAEVEWAGLDDHPLGGYHRACPACGQGREDDETLIPEHRGHAEDCKLGELIDYIREAE